MRRGTTRYFTCQLHNCQSLLLSVCTIACRLLKNGLFVKSKKRCMVAADSQRPCRRAPTLAPLPHNLLPPSPQDGLPVIHQVLGKTCTTCVCVYIYIYTQGVGLTSLAPTPFIRNWSSAHSQMLALVITHAGLGQYGMSATTTLYRVPGF